MKKLYFVLSLLVTTPLWSIPGDGFDIFLRGDANNDSAVDISDPSFIYSYLFQGGPAPSCMDAADANDDGRVDISDAVYLGEFLYQGGPPPPPPFPGCGTDPTSDNLGCNSSHCNS